MKKEKLLKSILIDFSNCGLHRYELGSKKDADTIMLDYLRTVVAITKDDVETSDGDYIALDDLSETDLGQVAEAIDAIQLAEEKTMERSRS